MSCYAAALAVGAAAFAAARTAQGAEGSAARKRRWSGSGGKRNSRSCARRPAISKSASWLVNYF